MPLNLSTTRPALTAATITRAQLLAFHRRAILAGDGAMAREAEHALRGERHGTVVCVAAINAEVA